MKFVIPGGNGHVGAAIQRHFKDHEIVILTRSPKNHSGVKEVYWDGVNLGDWTLELEDADVVINLAGRSVNCRYNESNLKEMMDSRTLSTRVLGQAIGQAKAPPRIWLQSSTATIYSHRFDAPNNEFTGIMGDQDKLAPRTWKASIDIAVAWEAELEAAQTPKTRKVALRSSMVMSVDQGSVFDVLATLARRGLGGNLGSGKQYVSWVHEHDFVRALEFIIQNESISGPINVCSPNPLPQSDFAKTLRTAVNAKFGLPATEWMIEIGTWAMRTESELVLKSRRVIPSRLLQAGFEFNFPCWTEACAELTQRQRAFR